jgi:hypothetical protein
VVIKSISLFNFKPYVVGLSLSITIGELYNDCSELIEGNVLREDIVLFDDVYDSDEFVILSLIFSPVLLKIDILHRIVDTNCVILFIVVPTDKKIESKLVYK